MHRISRLSLRKIAYVIILVPVIIYFGFRLNPSLNPEKKMWGSFDPQFAMDFSLNYSGVSEEKLAEGAAQGRWGSSLAIISNVFSNPLSSNNMLGSKRSRSGYVDLDEFDSEAYGIMSAGVMISTIGVYLLTMGWPATLLWIMISILIIRTIQDRHTRFILLFLYSWGIIFYSGMFGVGLLTYIAILSSNNLKTKVLSGESS
jgi:hypothetical protein